MRRLWRNVEGAEIAEAAVVLPLLFMFLLGIVWFGRAFNIYSTIHQAAQRGAITAARATCATCGNTTASDTDVTNAVSSIMLASSLSLDEIQAAPYPSPRLQCPGRAAPACAPVPIGTTGALSLCRSMVLNPGTLPAQCGTVVTFQYPFTFFLPFTSLNLQEVLMTAQAQTRVED